MQSRFGEGSGEDLGGFGAEAEQVQRFGGSGEGSGRLCARQVSFYRVPEKVPEKAWEALEQAEVFPTLGFTACFRNICKNKTLRRLLGIGYHASLFLGF